MIEQIYTDSEIKAMKRMKTVIKNYPKYSKDDNRCLRIYLNDTYPWYMIFNSKGEFKDIVLNPGNYLSVSMGTKISMIEDINFVLAIATKGKIGNN